MSKAAEPKVRERILAQLKTVQQRQNKKTNVTSSGYKVSPFCPHSPFPKQELFLRLPHHEAFYGGAAGGGKSDTLLMAALEYVEVPGYAALMLRRTYPDLTRPGALMDRAREWLTGSGANWNDTKKQWRFPSGAVLQFGYLEQENDKYNYQGAEFQAVFFDEASQFEEGCYTYLFSRLRRLKDSPIPLRMRCASNPGNIGAGWIKERFIPEGFTPDMAIPIKVWEKVSEDDPTIVRAFVPSRLADNPALDQVEYRKSLRNLGEIERMQLLDGNWAVQDKGNIFANWSDGREGEHVITWSQFRQLYGSRNIPENWSLAVGHDFGMTKKHPAVISLIARAAENSILPGLYFVVFSRTYVDTIPDKIAEGFLKTLKEYEIEPQQVETMRMSHEASSERATYRDKYNLHFYSGSSDKRSGIAQITHLLNGVRGATHPFKGLQNRPYLYFIVDDDQVDNPKDDRGLKRLRDEMSTYRWAEPQSRERGLSASVPHKYFDDAIDSLRFIFSVSGWGPEVAELSAEERIEASLLPEYRADFLKTLSPDRLEFHRAMADWERKEAEREEKAKSQSDFDRFFAGTV